MAKLFFVYIMTNARKSVLYTGVTSDLPRRVYEHKEGLTGGFTSRYNVTDLVYYESAYNAYNAISQEKQIKAGSRRTKIALINAMKPGWQDRPKPSRTRGVRPHPARLLS